MDKIVKKKIYDTLASVRSPYMYHLAVQLIRDFNKKQICGNVDLLRLYQRGVGPEEVKHFNKVLNIKKALYDYEYFNVCFLNNMVALCVRAVCEGYIPRIEIINSNGENVWEMLFQQPFSDVKTTGLKEVVVKQRDYLEVFPSFEEVYSRDRILYWGNAYRLFINFNDDVQQYIDDEIKTVIDDWKVLGVLCRGTDYIKTRPKGHPVQPDIQMFISKTKEFFEKGGYHKIYLATEDSRYDKAFREYFGEILLINKRQYYDNYYLSQNISLIKDVHFERDNDEYLKGLEYLSSLQILSHCQGLVAGNCSGTQAAVFWNNGAYEDQYVFDLGLYD